MERTAIARIHICNQRRPERIQIRDHIGIVPHVMKLGNGQVWLTQTRGSCSGTGLYHAMSANGNLGSKSHKVCKIETSRWAEKCATAHHIQGLEAELDGRTCR